MRLISEIHQADHFTTRDEAEQKVSGNIPRNIDECDYKIRRHRDGYVIELLEANKSRVLGYLTA